MSSAMFCDAIDCTVIKTWRSDNEFRIYTEVVSLGSVASQLAS